MPPAAVGYPASPFSLTAGKMSGLFSVLLLEMPRRLRFVPSGSLVEVTCRTVQGRLLLLPTGFLREIVLGILARARDRYPGVAPCAFVFMSNHFHLLATAASAKALADFMRYVNSNLAKEAGRLHDWKEKLWGSRYHAIVVSEEEQAQVERLRYLFSHGVKEGLVWSLRDWPGAHSLDAQISGEPLRGLWFDRTREGQARRGAKLDTSTLVSEETLVLAPLPCWAHLPPAEARERTRELAEEVDAHEAELLRAAGREPLGPERVLRQSPHQRPMRMKRSPAPVMHAASRSVRLAFHAVYRRFVLAFRAAAERLRAGLDAVFPPGSFPPALPWVPEPAPT